MDPMDLEECGEEEHCYCDVPTYYQGLEPGLDVSDLVVLNFYDLGLDDLSLDDPGLDDQGLDDPSFNEVSDGFFSRKSEKKPNCQPDKKPSCPKSSKSSCPKPSKPACPKPASKPSCPKPASKPSCPKPASKPSCPKPASKPSCPKPASKPSCPKPASKPACPPKPASSCPKPSKPACPPASACKRRQNRKHPKLPRSRNPFIIFFLSLYFKDRCRKVTDVARDAGKQWCRMSPKDKEQYRKLAKAEQKRQQRKHCGSRRKSKKHGRKCK